MKRNLSPLLPSAAKLINSQHIAKLSIKQAISEALSTNELFNFGIKQCLLILLACLVFHSIDVEGHFKKKVNA